MQLLRNEPLQARNTLALKSRAAAYVAVSDEAGVLEAINLANAEGLTLMPLGEGSNVVLVGDQEALVVQLENRGIETLGSSESSIHLRVAAGTNWHQLVGWSLAQGFYGLENLALIPGTVGAAPIQNIGAYGVECEQFIRTVEAREIATGALQRFSASECAFGYRHSNFKGHWRDQLLITAVELELPKQPQVNISYPALAKQLQGQAEPTPQQVFDAVVAIRQSRLPDPALEPNAGSFFKNPILPADRAGELQQRFQDLPVYPQADGQVKIPAAWLIDACGWKGQRRGGMGVHPQHALVLVNYSGDSGEELMALAREISHSVVNTFGVTLEIEPRVYKAK